MAMVAGLFLVAAGAVALWLWSRPAPVLRASVTFAGYTNSATGARVATFSVTNLSTMSVRRWDFCEIEDRETGTAIEFHIGPDTFLAPQSVEIMVLPVPTNQAPWRVTFHFSRKGWRQRASDVRSQWRFLARIIPQRFLPILPVEHQARSDWITP